MHKDPAARSAWRKKNYRANRERLLTQNRAWRLANKARAEAFDRGSELRKWGMRAEGYERMLYAQDCACAICGATTPGGGRRHFSIDHCHKTGSIRGLLCGRCNTGLGMFRDNPAALRKAAEYLTAYPESTPSPFSIELASTR